MEAILEAEFPKNIDGIWTGKASFLEFGFDPNKAINHIGQQRRLVTEDDGRQLASSTRTCHPREAANCPRETADTCWWACGSLRAKGVGNIDDADLTSIAAELSSKLTRELRKLDYECLGITLKFQAVVYL